MTRYGVIGTGFRGRTHLTVLKELGAPVVALCDVTPAALAEAAPLAPGARHYADYRVLLADPEVDAVVIVTPNFLHREQAIAALDAGKHVLCEKPLATTVEDAQAILDAANKSGRAFLAGHELRFAPVYLALKALLDQGVIGRLVQIAHMELRWDWNPKGWRVHDPARGELVNWRHLAWATGGTLLEKSCHFTDLFNLLTGEAPTDLHMTAGIGHYRDGRTNPDHLAATFTYPNGIIASHVLCMNHDPMHDEMRLLGTEGELIVNLHETIDLRRYGHPLERIYAGPGDPATRGTPVHTGDLEMHQAFARMIAGAPAPFDQRWAVVAVDTGERARSHS